MNKIFWLVMMVVLGLGAGWTIVNINRDQNNQGHLRALYQIKATPTPEIGMPENLIIPLLNIYAPIESVTTEKDGSMGIPSGPNSTGWYSLGPKPGEIGSAVIDGHYDWDDGPAVFYKINLLKPGDKIVIKDRLGGELNFEVKRIETYPENSFPLAEVFANREGKKLNLITCKGIFDAKTKNYSQRLVVYSELLD